MSKANPRAALLLAGFAACCGVAWLVWLTASPEPAGTAPAPLEHPAPTASASPRLDTAARSTAEVGAAERSRAAAASAQLPAVGTSATRTESAGLEGSLVWHDSVDHSAFAVTCRRTGERPERPLRLDRRGDFGLRSLEPGPVTVLVRAAGYVMPLETVVDVVVPQVGVGRDRRIQRIDVTRVRRVTLFYRETGGRPIDGDLRALCVTQGECAEFVGEESGEQRGALSILVCAPQTVVASAVGYLPQRVVVSDNRTVVLHRAARVRVHLRVHGAVSEVKYVDLHLETPSAARARRQGGPNGSFHVAASELARVELVSSEFDAERKTVQATFAVFVPGTYHASWSVLGGSPEPERVPVGVVEIHALGSEQDVWLWTTVEELYTASGRQR